MSDKTMTSQVLARIEASKKAKKELAAQQAGNGAIQEEQALEAPKSNKVRNFAIGVGAALLGLFFLRRKSSPLSAKLNLEANMQLTPNFVLGEFLVSSEMPELKQYILSKGELDNVTRLASVLQLLRNGYGRRLRVTSGGRPDTVRIKSGKYAGMTMVQMLEEKGYSPSSYSQHFDFSAADFTVEAKADLVTIYRMILDLENHPSFGPEITQAILYIQNGAPDFIHLGVKSVVNTYTIKPENKYLLAKVTVVKTNDGQVHRSTKMSKYSKVTLDSMIQL